MVRGARGRTNRAISPAVIVHAAQQVKHQPDPNQLIQQVQPNRNLLTVDQAWDEVFERSISKTKLYQMLQQGKVPAVRIGAKYLLRRDTLEAWMQQQEQVFR